MKYITAKGKNKKVMYKMTKVKKLLTLDDDIVEFGKIASKEYGLSFSGYVSMLFANERKKKQQSTIQDVANVITDAVVDAMEKSKQSASQ